MNRIANVLVGQLGLVTGGRVLLRSANNPMMVATYLAVLKAGGIVVATMPLLRAKELAYPIQKARVALALCDGKLADEMEKAKAVAPELKRIVYWGSKEPGSLEQLIADASPEFSAVDTASDDICLIAFTSGTTGDPKGTMHFHRDMLAVCDGYAHNILRASPQDRFIGSAPLAFTFGFGGVLFPMHIGASFVVLEKAGPDDLPPAIEKYKATVCFTAPTSYRAMAGKIGKHDISSLRKCVSAGETLPKGTFDAWLKATGIKLMDGIGSTEMLHIFISAIEDEIRPGATASRCRVMKPRSSTTMATIVPAGTMGRLAVRGPTGCRYLADERQRKYVQNGWNVTGDTYVMDEDGYFWYQSRSDDMIVSAGYNIAGPRCRSRVADASGGGRMWRGRRPRRGPWHDRQGLCDFGLRYHRRCRADHRPAGSRQARDRALQISARDRIRRRLAEDRNRQAEAVFAAADRDGRRGPRRRPARPCRRPAQPRRRRAWPRNE